MEIKPIRTETDYEQTLQEIERLLNAELDTPDGDRLEVLSILVEDYENKNYPILPPDPIEAIEYHMERLGLTRKDLEAYIGGPSRVSEILNRKRPLNIRMMRRLSAGLGIPIDILAQPYELNEVENKFDAAFVPFFVGTALFDFKIINSTVNILSEKGSLTTITKLIPKPNYQTVGSSETIIKPRFVIAGNALSATERTM